MAEDAVQAAALKAYAETLRELDDHGEGSGTMSTTAFLPFQFDADENDAMYGLSMEDQARMMLMDRLNTDSNIDVGGRNSLDQQQMTIQMNELLLQELL